MLLKLRPVDVLEGFEKESLKTTLNRKLSGMWRRVLHIKERPMQILAFFNVLILWKVSGLKMAMNLLTVMQMMMNTEQTMKELHKGHLR